MAEFNFTPDFGAQADMKPNVNNIKFGDGYEQRASFGVNIIKEVWSISFSNRTKSEIDSIDAFLKSRMGVDSFDWMPPDSTVLKKFKCQVWKKDIVKGSHWGLTATFEQVFEG